MNKPMIDYYDELGISSKATQEEIKKAYQKMVLKVHPDKVDPTLSAEKQQKMLHQYHVINRAWKVLGDTEKREHYDKGLREQSLLQEWPVNAEVDLDDMELNEGTQTGCFSWRCRCSGQYIITEEDLEKAQNVVCCSMCTLCIRVMYAVVSDQDESHQEEQV
ncbi:hypothetical protein QZH41_013454 [Actinostola sp. cb2023]|nr:hypothetical protein QZH41_013454 [Actinostola sp. cb2023]